MKFDRLIEKARSIAPNIDERSKSKHVSFLLKKNKIVSYGWNQPFKTGPLGARNLTRFSCLHSEAHAIMKSRWRVSELNKLTLVNIRFRKDGSISMSKPCCFCQKMLDTFQLTEVYYTNSDGEFEKL